MSDTDHTLTTKGTYDAAQSAWRAYEKKCLLIGKYVALSGNGTRFDKHFPDLPAEARADRLEWIDLATRFVDAPIGGWRE